MEAILLAVVQDTETIEKAQIQQQHDRRAAAFTNRTTIIPPTVPAPINPAPTRPGDTPFWQSNADLFPAAIREALQGGLDPNARWVEIDVVRPRPKTGCTVYALTPEDDAWFHWNTPLHRATCLGALEEADVILKAGGAINTYNAFGRTALHEAIYSQKRDTTRFLLERGASTEVLTVEQRVSWDDAMATTSIGELSPLHVALFMGDVAAMEALVDAGADVSRRDGGWTLLDLAILAGDSRAVALLMRREGQVSIHSGSTTDKPGPLSASTKDYARELLAVASSNQLQPPAHLHQVYLQALSTCTPLPSASLPETQQMIKELFQRLYDLAGLESKAPPPDLCSSCIRLQAQLDRDALELHPTDSSYQLHDSPQDLKTSVENGCSLCAVVSDAFTNAEPERRVIFSNTSQSQEEDTSTDPSICLSFLSPHAKRPVSLLQVQSAGKTRKLRLDHLPEDMVPDSSVPKDTHLGVTSQRSAWSAKKWLDNCNSSPGHQACQHVMQHRPTVPLPSRLLHVGNDQQDPYLVENVTEAISYVALSYCRGSYSDTLRTTQANVEHHKQRIALDGLPALFQDAILTTRGLGLQYIWIDVLCTICDVQHDWAEQVSRMHGIYLNAELTISSLTAETVSDTLYSPRPPNQTPYPVPLNLWQPKPSRPPHKPKTIHRIAARRDWLETNNQSPHHTWPIQSQASTLQEQLLSTRVLYFGPGMLHWDCPRAYQTEANPGWSWLGAMGGLRRAWAEAKAVMRGLGGQKGVPDWRMTVHRVWETQLEEYTKNAATQLAASERLPAFWGFGTYMGTLLGNEFLGGIFLGDRFLESLCWTSVSSSGGTPQRPSWTWASSPAPVSFDALNRGDRSQRMVPLCGLHSQTVAEDPITCQVTGSITLQGTSYPAHILDTLPTTRFTVQYYPDYHIDTHFSPPQQQQHLYALDLVGFTQGPRYQGLGLPAYPRGEPMTKVVMILTPVDEDSLGVFRRVGILVLELKSWSLDEELAKEVRRMWVGEDEGGGFGDVVTLV